MNASVLESKHLQFTQAQAELNSRTETLSGIPLASDGITLFIELT